MINWTVRSAVMALAFAVLLSLLMGAAASPGLHGSGGAPSSAEWSDSPDAPDGVTVSPALSLSERLGVPACATAPPCVPVADGVASVAPTSLAPEPGRTSLAGERVSVAVDGLRFRSGPGTGYAARGLLYSGDDLFVVEEYAAADYRGDWVGVLVQSSLTGLPYEAFGYVHRAYVS